MFLNIAFENDIYVQRQANLYKFQDTIKNLMKSWNSNWYFYDENDYVLIFQNNQCERLTISLNQSLKTFDILFEFDKYKDSQINVIYQNLNVNEFTQNTYNNIKFLGTKIMELQILAYEKNFKLLKEKNQKRIVKFKNSH